MNWTNWTRRKTMKKTWLSALKGLAVSEAEGKVKGEGLACKILPEGSARIMLAVANTVFLYANGDKVVSVEVGDPTELLD
jgi:hypothetical protein